MNMFWIPKKLRGLRNILFFYDAFGICGLPRGSSHLEILDDKRYQRAAMHFDLENLNRQEAFAKILEEAVEFLDFLISVVRSGKLSDEDDGDC